ncbi:MAG: SDR family NAD(P)-dependent oxidoreductase [Erythrobacter sp.]
MTDNRDNSGEWPRTVAVFGASGGIGRALCQELAKRGCERIYAGSRSGDWGQSDLIIPFAFNLTDEDSIASAAQMMRDDPPEWVIIATGALSLEDGTGPERSHKRIDAAHMANVLAVNAIGPAIIAKHVLPLFPRSSRGVFAALSARVGSIGDNRMGGWHSYRASKAALNMLLRNFAIEQARTHPNMVVAGLHPGTVDTQLSQPFQSNVPEGKLFTPEHSAKRLLGALRELRPEDSGYVFDWAGKRIPD